MHAVTNQIRVGTSVAKYTGGTYESINNATRLASLLQEIGTNVAAAVERHRQQFRITADWPASATGNVGKVNVGVKPPSSPRACRSTAPFAEVDDPMWPVSAWR